jgi:large repetitive protein
MTNVRRNLAVQIVPAGGTNPLKMRLAGGVKFTLGIASSTAALIAQGGTPAYAYSIVGGALPTGLSLAGGTGVISGTPSVAGTATFTAQVQDAASTVFQATFTINVAHKLVGVTATPIPFEKGFAYSYSFGVSGFTGTLTWSISSGAVPTGVTINSASGILSGTPTSVAPADFVFVVTVSDSGTTDSISFPCGVHLYDQLRPSGTTPHIALIVGITRELSQAALGYQAGGPPYSLSVNSGFTLPAGVTFVVKPTTGTVQFTSTAAFISTPLRWNVRDTVGNTTLGSQMFLTGVLPGPSTDVANALMQGTDGALFVPTTAINANVPPSGMAIPAQSSAVVVRNLTIPAGQKVTLGAGAILRIL